MLEVVKEYNHDADDADYELMLEVAKTEDVNHEFASDVANANEYKPDADDAGCEYKPEAQKQTTPLLLLAPPKAMR